MRESDDQPIRDGLRELWTLGRYQARGLLLLALNALIPEGDPLRQGLEAALRDLETKLDNLERDESEEPESQL